MKQIILARKDLDMSPGKLAAQVSHASIAWLAAIIKDNATKDCGCIFNTQDPDGNRINYQNHDLDEMCKKHYEAGDTYFCTNRIDLNRSVSRYLERPASTLYEVEFELDKDIYEKWILGASTKVVCQAKNRNQLLKAVQIAENLGLKMDKDFFLIKDNCYTELEPEEYDAEGNGHTLTCIGFKPLPDDIASAISKKYQLYR